MEAMQTNAYSEALRSRGGFRRPLAHLVGALIAGAIWLGTSPAFASCPPGTLVDVEPAGDSIAGDLKPGSGGAKFTLGLITVTCNVSHTSGVIPVAGNPGDPVTGTLTAPTFTSCTTNVGLSATVMTNSTNGSWTLSATCGGQATLHIPQAGAKTTVGGCTITVAPNGAVNVPAMWTNGSPSMLKITNASLPISKTGFGCPSGTTASFSATYNITDTTDPSEDVTVTEVP